MIEDVIYICILRRRQQQRTELITNIYQDIKREMSYPPEPKKVTRPRHLFSSLSDAAINAKELIGARAHHDLDQMDKRTSKITSIRTRPYKTVL